MADIRYKKLADVLQAIRGCTAVMQFSLDIPLDVVDMTLQGQLAISEVEIEGKSYTTVLIDGKGACKVFNLYLLAMSVSDANDVRLICNGKDIKDADFSLLLNTLDRGLAHFKNNLFVIKPPK